MSSIDERVVRMEFDNKQFESGVSTTMSTLEKLKEALRFREGTTGFDDIQKASSNINFSSLNDRLWQVQQNFSFFGEFVETVFTRISNKIIDVGSMMVRELTTAPLQAGYSEYELMMGSLNTIMASAAEREGKSLEDVMGYLDQLNTYADKTIYSFSDMTQNIGKFTNAGVPLETAVKAIQGISNEAAVSGANAQEASRAMYNFAQALSAGYVKLIDWKSIENANMATVEFKQQLLDTAVELGTVERTADGMYRVLGTNANGATMREAISATQNFNDSLAYQWMTSDVLTTTLAKYADETTEIGQKAFKAATEVKTFSQLIDTVKESLGSGWTKSFQYMIGDLDEAKVLWTGVNEEINAILDPIAEAREEMLKFWHDNGGRADAIQAISDAWQGLKAIMGAVSAAFKTVFPPMTGERLVEITKSIADMAAKFKDFATSSELLADIRIMMQGLFSVVRRVVGVFKSFVRMLSPLIHIFAEFGKYIFEATYWFSLFIGGVANAKKPLKYFLTNLSTLNKVAHNVIAGIEELAKAILDFLGIHIDANPLTSFYDTLSDIVDSFGSGIVNGIASLSTKISETFATLISGIQLPKIDVSSIGGFFESIGTAVSEWVPSIIEYLGSQDFRDALSNAGLLAGTGLLVSLTKLSGNLSSMADGAKEFENAPSLFERLISVFKDMIQPLIDLGNTAVDTFVGVIDQVRDHVDAFQTSLRPTKLIVIAVSLGIIASAISVLANIEPDRAADAIATLVVSLAILVGGLKLLMEALRFSEVDKRLPGLLIKMAIALYALSLAVKTLSDLGWDKLESGLKGVGILLAEMALFLNVANKMTVGFGGIVAIIAVAAAIKLLENTVSTFSGMDWSELLRGLAGVGVLIFELGAFMKAIDKASTSLRGVLALIAVTGAIKVLEGVVSSFSGIGWDALSNGLAGVGFIIVELSAFMLILSGMKIPVSSILALAVMSYVLTSIGNVVASISSVAGSNLESSIISIAVVLGTLTLALVVLGEGSPMMIIGAAALVVVAKALEILIPLITSLADVDYESLLKSLGALGLGMVGLAIGVTALGFVSPLVVALSVAIAALGVAFGVVGAAVGVFGTGLMAVAQACEILGGFVKSLSEVAFGDLLKTLGSISLGMIALSVGLVALGLVSPMIIAISIAIAALGASVAIVGGAIGIFGTGLLAVTSAITAFVASVTAASGAMGAIATAIVETLVSVGEGIAGGIIAFVERIPEILTALGEARTSIFTFLVESKVDFLSFVGGLILSLLSLAASFIPQAASVVVQFVAAIVQVIVVWMPMLAQLLVTGVVTLINSVANGIRDNSESILAAVRNILSSIIELVFTALADIVRMIPGVGDTLAGMIESGRDGVRQSLAPESFEGIAGDAMDAAVKGIEQGGVDLSSAADSAGSKTHEGFLEGLGGSEGISEEFMGPILDGFSGKETEFFDVGALDSASFVDGFGSVSGSDGSSDALIQSVLGSLQGHEGDFASAAVSDAESYASGFENSSAGDKASMLAQSAANALGASGSLFSDEGTKSADKYATSLGNGKAKDKGASLASSGASGASSKRGAYSSAGTDMAAGFNYGIASPYALSLARSAGARLGQSALDGVRNRIRSASPSKETMKLGKYTSQGFAIGIKSLTSTVYKTSENVGQQAIDGIKDSLGTMAQYLDEDLEVDPTIRPVMDLSEIQNGVTQMNRLVDNGTPAPLIGVGMDPYARMMMSSMLSLPGFGNPTINRANETTYNLYIDGARINDDVEIRNVILDTFDVLGRKGAMNVGNQ